MGANFVLDKPISLDRATRSVRAAQGLIMRERRRYHRHLIKATGAILVDQGAELPLNITNISHGGISIECSRKLDEAALLESGCNCQEPSAHWTLKAKWPGRLRKAALEFVFRCFQPKQKRTSTSGWREAGINAGWRRHVINATTV